tara:strand:- start:821 stop:1660 length:840 start_codon:yes stop_codon:yes gene_type:complete
MPRTPTITPPNYDSSGTAPTSGIPARATTYAGPFHVEEQRLDFDFHRIPIGTLDTHTLSLSGVTVTERHQSTLLICEVQASYKTYKDWAVYDTSAWQRPQTFQFLTFSADTQGNTYGTTDASTLGPLGSVITGQSYYSRRFWDDASGDGEMSKQITGTTYYVVNGADEWTTGGLSALTQTDYNDDFTFWWISSTRKGTLKNDWSPRGGYQWLYQIPGTYSTDKEDIYKIFQTIDTIGNLVNYSQLYKIPVDIGTTATGYSYPLPNEGISEYKITRHNYS